MLDAISGTVLGPGASLLGTVLSTGAMLLGTAAMLLGTVVPAWRETLSSFAMTKPSRHALSAIHRIYISTS